jgi:hypothetical protein
VVRVSVADRNVETVVELPTGNLTFWSNVDISPNGDRIVAAIDHGGSDLWLAEGGRTAIERDLRARMQNAGELEITSWVESEEALRSLASLLATVTAEPGTARAGAQVVRRVSHHDVPACAA